MQYCFVAMSTLHKIEHNAPHVSNYHGKRYKKYIDTILIYIEYIEISNFIIHTVVI